jgi:hypothetical protein
MQSFDIGLPVDSKLAPPAGPQLNHSLGLSTVLSTSASQGVVKDDLGMIRSQLRFTVRMSKRHWKRRLLGGSFDPRNLQVHGCVAEDFEVGSWGSPELNLQVQCSIPSQMGQITTNHAT